MTGSGWTGHGWTELRVAAGREEQDALIADAVAPLVTEATGSFMVRDQIAGRDMLRVWLPSVAGQEPALALDAELRRRRPRVEIVMIQDSSFTPDDSPYGGPAVTAFWHDLLTDATTLLIGQVASIAARRRTRATVAIDLMTAHLPAVDFTKAYSARYPVQANRFAFPLPFAALRSHADGFFMLSRDPHATRAEMDRRYLPMAPAIQRRSGAVLAQVDGSGPVVSADAAAWHRFARSYLDRADRELRSGRLTTEFEDGYLTDGRDASVSPFHQSVAANEPFQRFLRVDAGYQAMRVMMTALYLGLNVIGVRLAERFFLCHAVSRACESLFAVDVVKIMTEMADVFATTVGTLGATGLGTRSARRGKSAGNSIVDHD